MKTIHIAFLKDGQQLAAVTGEFATVPGLGKLSWENKAELEAILVSPYRAPLTEEHYAELFKDAMLALASRHGLQSEVAESGDWTVYQE